MNCPKCGQPMECLGNVSGVIYTSYPEQWDDVWACHACKVRVPQRRHSVVRQKLNVDDYEWVRANQ